MISVSVLEVRYMSKLPPRAIYLHKTSVISFTMQKVDISLDFSLLKTSFHSSDDDQRYCGQVVQEYERAVIFRLGRLLNGGAKGPGQKQSDLVTHKATRAIS